MLLCTQIMIFSAQPYIGIGAIKMRPSLSPSVSWNQITHGSNQNDTMSIARAAKCKAVPHEALLLSQAAAKNAKDHHFMNICQWVSITGPIDPVCTAWKHNTV